MLKSLLEYGLEDNHRMWATLQKETMGRLSKGIPHWMDVLDIFHAGWLGYQEGLNRADPSKGDPHPFAKKWAIGCMQAEITSWFGAGRRRDDFELRAETGTDFFWDQFFVHPDPTEEEIKERESWECDVEKIFSDLLNHLTPNQRQAVYLHYMESFTYKEVAEKMGLSRNQVTALILSGLNTLRKLVVTHPFQRRVAA